MKVLKEGYPFPLGSHYDGKGTNFAVSSANCGRVELCLFDEQGNEERYELAKQNGDIWYGYLPDCQPGQRYGYRVYGPYMPTEGHRFNPNKVIFDPYSRELTDRLQESPLLFVGGDRPDEQDSAPAVPKSIVVHEEYDWEGDEFPYVPPAHTVIYEAT